MAWIESHQELAHHPKVGRLAGMLDVEPPHVIGYLHCLWWWCLSYADDGDVTDFSAYELAWAAQWRGDPDVFVKALSECGWLDAVDGRTEVHDWWDYAGKLVERRRVDAERKREARSKKSTARPPDVHKDGVRTQHNPTVPNTTTQSFQDFHRQKAVEKVEALINSGKRVTSKSGYVRTLLEDDDDLRVEAEHEFAHRDCVCDGGYVFKYPQAGGRVRMKCQEVTE